MLLEAFGNKCARLDRLASDIKKVIEGDHRTYKYILITGLLAKATNKAANALSLQARAPFDGAFDARSLCHEVVVPFERDFLQNALGGSNEPFLNKPARFTHLSADNAVRAVADKVTLQLLISIFNRIKTSAIAKAYLSCALECLTERIAVIKKLRDTTIEHDPTLVEVYALIFNMLKKSFEGEVAAIVVGTLEKIYHRRLSGQFKVIAHKPNQSGASRKEVGDIDIFKDDQFQYASEVKDKDFNEYDIDHVFRKMIEQGASKGQFIFGPNASFDRDAVTKKIEGFEAKGFMVLFKTILSYARMMLVKIDLDDKQEFIQVMMNTADEINCKELTLKWIQVVLAQSAWK